MTNDGLADRSERDQSERNRSAAGLPVLLVLNAGSSSLKFALYLSVGGQRLARGQIADLADQAEFRVTTEHENQRLALHRSLSQAEALDRVLEWVSERRVKIVAAVHRVVHSGGLFDGAVRVTARILEQLSALEPLARLHQPHNLAALRRLAELAPEMAQIACFDTAFHAHWSAPTQRYPLPAEYFERGFRRFGFHGLSYAWIAERMSELEPAARRVVVAHLGSGASVCALREGRSVECTLGYSPLGGIPMATRSGDLDPGLLIALTRDLGGDLDALEDLLGSRSGLAGWSGADGDMRLLLQREDDLARQAVASYSLAVARAVASLSTVLGGIDALVFTAGVGEYAAPVRAAVCSHLAWLGVQLDQQANSENAPRLSSAQSSVRVWRIPTDEEQQMANEAARLLS